MSEKRWGATPEEWDEFVALGLTADLLPVVSNPNAVISPRSKMKALGKTPSMYDREGQVVGIVNWPERQTTPEQVAAWREEPDYGQCCIARFLRPLDVDIKDPILAATVRTFLQSKYKFPVRFRADSSKFLVCFYLEGDFTKRVIKLDDVKGGPIIEFLGNQQQFLVAGAHIDKDGISRDRYEWAWDGLHEPPTLTAEEFEALWAELVAKFGVSVLGGGALRREREASAKVVTNDPVALYLMEKDCYLGEGKDGMLNITCPWFDNHSMDSGDTQTTYMPPGGRGYQQGHFKCLHAGCADKNDSAFLDAIGYSNSFFKDLGPLPVEPGKAVALPRPPFDCEKSGHIKATLDNLALALERSDICKMHLRTDSFRDEIMCAPHNQPRAWRPLKDTDYTRLRRWLERNKFNTIGRELMRDALQEHAERFSFDSAIEWLTEEIPDWDGVKRVETFFTENMGVEDSAYTRAVARYLFSAMAGRVLEPGVQADMVPILVGPQGYRKSSAVRALSPSPKFFVEIDLGEKDDNLARRQRGKLLGEIAELNGLHTRDLEWIKACVARPSENWVPKYKEFSTEYPRRLVFIGTTNAVEFLGDTSGERRWLPLTVTRVADIENIVKCRPQLWAEARELFLAGGVDWRGAEYLAGDAHEKHTMTDVWEEEILRWLDTPNEVGAEGEETPRGRGFFTTAQVMDGALGQLAKNSKRGDEMRISKILHKLRCEKGKRNDVRGWFVFP